MSSQRRKRHQRCRHEKPVSELLPPAAVLADPPPPPRTLRDLPPLPQEPAITFKRAEPLPGVTFRVEDPPAIYSNTSCACPALCICIILTAAAIGFFILLFLLTST